MGLCKMGIFSFLKPSVKQAPGASAAAMLELILIIYSILIVRA